jgi:hypothetical protein
MIPERHLARFPPRGRARAASGRSRCRATNSCSAGLQRCFSAGPRQRWPAKQLKHYSSRTEVIATSSPITDAFRPQVGERFVRGPAQGRAIWPPCPAVLPLLTRLPARAGATARAPSGHALRRRPSVFCTFGSSARASAGSCYGFPTPSWRTSGSAEPRPGLRVASPSGGLEHHHGSNSHAPVRVRDCRRDTPASRRKD